MTWDPAARLLTISEAAKSVQRPESTIRRWISEGRLTPFAKLGHRPLIIEAAVLKVDADTRLDKRGEHCRGTLSP